jgi:predicted O-linked N-acetylglucosamine transferase (SPINDLY family)
MVNDRKLAISSRAPSRGEAGLPAHGFVFCALNATYKLREPMFDIWMRLLRDVDGSVLWLLGSNADATSNLRRAAAARGVDPDRLIFAARMPFADHLARQRLAGLFLDTLPYNAGATGCAALWAGVPVLTCRGRSFVGRMAESALHAVGLPELAATDLAHYEALARMLATDPPLLASLRARLERNRLSCPLFDTAGSCRSIEAAYAMMVEMKRRGEAPRSFTVAPA